MSLDSLKQRLQGENSDSAPATMILHKSKTIKVTVKELREATDANPNHPAAKVFRKAIERLPEDKTVIVDRADLQALIDNAEVEVIDTPGEHRGVPVVVRQKQVKSKPIAKTLPKESDKK